MPIIHNRRFHFFDAFLVMKGMDEISSLVGLWFSPGSFPPTVYIPIWARVMFEEAFGADLL